MSSSTSSTSTSTTTTAICLGRLVAEATMAAAWAAAVNEAKKAAAAALEGVAGHIGQPIHRWSPPSFQHLHEVREAAMVAAIVSGLVDRSYGTVRHGRIPSYDGEVVVEFKTDLGGDPQCSVRVAGYGPRGGADYVASFGGVTYDLYVGGVWVCRL